MNIVKKEKFTALRRISTSAIRLPPTARHGWLMRSTPTVPIETAPALVRVSFSPSKGTANSTVNIADICPRNETTGTGSPRLMAPMYVSDANVIIPPPSPTMTSSAFPGIVFLPKIAAEDARKASAAKANLQKV